MNVAATENFSFANCTHSAQRFLSKAQAVPVIGPIASSVKAVVSVAEIVSSVVLTFVFGICAIFTAGCFPSDDENWFFQALTVSINHLEKGCGGLAYSVANALTLGILGFYVEKAPDYYVLGRY